MEVELDSILQRVEKGEFDTRELIDEFHTGIPFIPRFPKDTTDRNRTSPFAFTGNKFEFRAVGSSVNIAMPNTVINSIVAESLNDLSTSIETQIAKGVQLGETVKEALAKMYKASKAVQYEGDNYSPAWHEEALSRQTADCSRYSSSALDFLLTDESLDLLESLKILKREEVVARHQIKSEIYVYTVELELRIARSMLRTMVLPAAFTYQKELVASCGSLAEILTDSEPDAKSQRDYIRKISTRINTIIRYLTELDRFNEELKGDELTLQMRFCADKNPSGT